MNRNVESDLNTVLAFHRQTNKQNFGPRRGATSVTRRSQTFDIDPIGWRKRSERRFSNLPLDQSVVERILMDAYAPTVAGTRAIPSSGGIYALRLFFYGKSKKTVYEYKANGSSLLESNLSDNDAHRSVHYQCQGEFLILVVVCELEPYVARYGSRGYRYALLEAGHLVQELIRNSQSAKLVSCPLGAFNDLLVRRIIGLLKDSDIPIYAFAIGHSENPELEG